MKHNAFKFENVDIVFQWNAGKYMMLIKSLAPVLSLTTSLFSYPSRHPSSHISPLTPLHISPFPFFFPLLVTANTGHINHNYIFIFAMMLNLFCVDFLFAYVTVIIRQCECMFQQNSKKKFGKKLKKKKRK